ncbi:Ankyrin repeat-containing protein [Chryseobacterium formosense]|uniref:ankyrin repeat domain-containing protein n=1 Tax=Chryseobacterium TaxID=59732 RepID=UPI00068A50FD|nr:MULTISPECIES: ankyrin repeat domain-containing protein [Chryseobacterium]OCK52428.1 hypothetical protein BA768_12620 [Chryseobacterium sp. CBo1]SFT84136.1 Ankyrin repeat-containing protein [Chryseobacterium formosense]
MKKIITTTLLIGFVALTNSIYAQQATKVQRQAIQTDNIETFKSAFTKAEYDKCIDIKERSYTMLSYSIRHNRKNITNFLLANNSDVNKACKGLTPLMVAATYGETEAAKLLLKKGANKNAKDLNGKTAKDYATENKQTATAAIL